MAARQKDPVEQISLIEQGLKSCSFSKLGDGCWSGTVTDKTGQAHELQQLADGSWTMTTGERKTKHRTLAGAVTTLADAA